MLPVAQNDLPDRYGHENAAQLPTRSPETPLFVGIFVPVANLGPVLGENQNSLYDYDGPFIWGGDHIPTSNKVILSVFQAVRAHFSPQKRPFWLKTPIFGSHYTHIWHSVSG